MNTYNSIAAATRDVRRKIADSEVITHPLMAPTLQVVMPNWTAALSGFQAGTVVSDDEAKMLAQIRQLYLETESWLEETAQDLNIGSLNEHDPSRVLFMGLFRDLQERFASKQNLNPHKLAVLFDGRYSVSE